MDAHHGSACLRAVAVHPTQYKRMPTVSVGQTEPQRLALQEVHDFHRTGCVSGYPPTHAPRECLQVLGAGSQARIMKPQPGLSGSDAGRGAVDHARCGAPAGVVAYLRHKPDRVFAPYAHAQRQPGGWSHHAICGQPAARLLERSHGSLDAFVEEVRATTRRRYETCIGNPPAH